MRVPDEPAVTTVPTVVGAVRDVSAVVKIADPIFGVDAYCADVDIITPYISEIEKEFIVGAAGGP